MNKLVNLTIEFVLPKIDRFQFKEIIENTN